MADFHVGIWKSRAIVCELPYWVIDIDIKVSLSKEGYFSTLGDEYSAIL
jgi:hypothetical protein